eukprot:383902_1
MEPSLDQTPWPHQPKDYEWKGTIRESQLTTKILAHCRPKHQDVIVEIKNMEMMWDMNEMDKYFSKIHEIMNIRHQNVLSPYHTFQHKSEIWIIYPLLSGGSLHELFTTQYVDGIPDENAVATILYDVACGLYAIHKNNLYHRNIRSSSLHMSKSTGRTLLKNFLSLSTFKWNRHNRQLQSNPDKTWITEEQMPFTDPLLLSSPMSPNPCDNASFFAADIYSFGVLAMELCFGYPPPSKTQQTVSASDTFSILSASSFDDYQRECPFSEAFQNLINECLSTTNRITVKHLLQHDYFTTRTRTYEHVMEYIQGIRSTEAKILPELNFRTTSIYQPPVKADNGFNTKDIPDVKPQLQAKESIELKVPFIPTNVHTKVTKRVVIQDDSWDFDSMVDELQSASPRNAPLVLDEVQYGDEEDQRNHVAFTALEHGMSGIKFIGSDDGGTNTVNTLKSPTFKPSLMANHTYSNTMQSTISRLSPLATTQISQLKFSKFVHQPQHSFKLPNIIRLNIGGEMFCTTLNTLRKYDTMLSKKFSGDYDAEYDETTDSYFIDRDGAHFKHILNYLRTGKLIIPRPFHMDNGGKYDALFYEELYEEACYYQVSDLISILNKDNIYFYSKILPDEYYVMILKKWISNPTGNSGINIEQSLTENNEVEEKNEADQLELQRRAIKNQKWRLIYRASDDGYAASDFHRLCDLQGPTVTLIHANKSIFGGYTDISWKSDGKDKYAASKQECINTFIFVMNITNKMNNLKAFKWNFIEKYYSSYGSNLPVAHERNIGPCFGWYHVLKKRGNERSNDMNININMNDNASQPTISQDGIIIGDKCNVQNNSCWTYCAYFNTPKGSADLAGSKYFFVKDIEVYQISFDGQ